MSTPSRFARCINPSKLGNRGDSDMTIGRNWKATR
jgi:hypothetical protein